MSREEILAWVGIIIGVPGFFLLFFSGQVVIGLLLLVIVIILIWLHVVFNRPEFSLLEVEKKLEFHDPQACRATLVRVQTAIANHTGLREFWVGNVTADGKIENILIDNKEPHYKKQESGSLLLGKRFNQPLKRGQRFTMRLSYDLVNSFNASSESLIHIVSYKTNRLRLVVQFHPDKPCRSARAFLRYGSQIQKYLPIFNISEDKCLIELEVKKPKLGAEYVLEWDW